MAGLPLAQLRLRDYAIAIAMILSGCASLPSSDNGSILHAKTIAIPLPPDRPAPGSTAEAYITDGIQLLRTGKNAQASKRFRQALAQRPRNVPANFLNAFTSHIHGRQGSASHYDNAAIGYQLALTFDPNAWWAASFYGELELERGRYSEASRLFEYAHSLKPDALHPLLGLTLGSYALGDAQSAAQSLAIARKLTPPDARIERLAALVGAAAGDDLRARERLETYRQLGADQGRAARLEQRIEAWRAFHTLAERDTTETEIAPSRQSAPTPQDDPSEPTQTTPSRQIVLEAIILRSTRSEVRQRGINLLEGLTAQFSYDNSRTLDRVTGSDDSVTQSITRAIGVSEVSYALNIFNSTTDHSEIIARPTLLAMEGKTSSFFSGDVFLASISGQFDGETLTERVGVSIEVTPTFLSDEDFILEVKLGESDFSTETVAGTFEEALSISSTETDVSARLQLGQSLLLAGLTERKQRQKRDQVPVLGDIPIVQELFRSKTTELVTSEIAILLTPLRAHKAPRMREIGRRGVRPTPLPIDAERGLLGDLRRYSEAPLARQFRKSDIRLDVLDIATAKQQVWEDMIGYAYF